MAGRGKLIHELLFSESDQMPEQYQVETDFSRRFCDVETGLDSRPSQSQNSESEVDDTRHKVFDCGPPIGLGRGKLLNNLYTKETVTINEANYEDITSYFENISIDPESSGTKSKIASFLCSSDEGKSVEQFSLCPKSKDSKQNKVQIQTNSLRISRSQQYNVYQYAIIVKPSIDSTSLISKLLDTPSVRSIIGKQGFALGFSLFVPQKIASFQQLVAHPHDQNSQVELKFKFIQILPLKEQAFIINILFKQVMKELNFVYMKNKYFDPTKKMKIEQYMIEIWPGFLLNVVEHDSNTFLLQCDITHRILQKTCVLSQLSVLRQQNANNFQMIARKQFVGESIITVYNNRTYRIDDIDFNSNPMSTFVQNNITITYVDYFKQHWGLDITDYSQPLIVHRKFQKSTQSVCWFDFGFFIFFQSLFISKFFYF